MAFVHPYIAGVTLYFSLALARPGTSLLVDEIDLLRAAVRDVLRKRPFHIDAFVVLPDGLHAVWTLPEADPNYSERWGNVKSHFSRHLRRTGRAPDPPPGRLSAKAVRRGEVGIWAQGFTRRVIADAEDYRAALCRCHDAPVMRNLVSRPQDWPYSSLHRDRRLSGSGAPDHHGAALPVRTPQPAQSSLFALG
ncbi:MULTISPECIES: transposase [unclassified Roseivivax]|uniref:REP-associated tyrosine transposase n=1 Tax=unclassified Roseivivax TaxID=2639302 RepID=UPI001267C813|nr:MULTISPECIES: transposase [unclassified Roseivivax]